MPYRRGSSSGQKGKGGLPRDVQVSKAMSLTLRHRAASDGLKMDKNGYVNVAELLALRRFQTLSVKFSELRQIVAENDKQRFTLIAASDNADASKSQQGLDDDPSHYLIRANQGHSIAISSEDLLKPILVTDSSCPHQVVHGTDPLAWKGILKSGGLNKMGRQHIHFATGIPNYHKKSGHPSNEILNLAEEAQSTDKAKEDVVGDDGTTKSASSAKSGSETVISGMRKNASIMIWVDLVRSAKDGGLKWWRSDNGVILTEGDTDGWVKMEWCDGGKPVCQRCRKSKRVCFGISTEQEGFVVHSENSYASGLTKRPRGPRSAPNINLTGKLGPELQPASIDLKTHAFIYYLHHNSKTREDIPVLSTGVCADVLPMWTSTPEWPMIHLAVSCLALAVFSRSRQYSPAIIEASKFYDHLLQMMQTNLLSIREVNIEACLLVVFYMGRYEEAVHQPSHHDKGVSFITSLPSFSHHDGALAILRIWRKQLSRSQPASDVIKHIRRGLIRSALIRNLAVPAWMQDGSDFGEEGLELKYDSILVRIVGIRHRLSTLVKNDELGDHQCKEPCLSAEQLSEEALDIDIALQDWTSLFPPAWRYERHSLPDSHQWPVKDFYSPVVSVYSSPSYAAVWNQYHTVRMLINNTHLRILRLCHTQSAALTAKRMADCRSALEFMGNDLASNVPFCLQRFKVTKSVGSVSSGSSITLNTDNDIKPYLATLLIWPLSIASSLTELDVKQRRWLRSQLARLGSVVGYKILELAETDQWPEM